jgi:hypothetical protein
VTALGREITGELSRSALEALPSGATFRLVVDGESMTPALKSGDAVVARRTGSRADWGLGDILVVDVPGIGLVVHRVVWTGREAVRTRGDGSGLMDRPVPMARVLGRVVEVARDGREVAEPAWRRRLAGARGFLAAARGWASARWARAMGR